MNDIDEFLKQHPYVYKKEEGMWTEEEIKGTERARLVKETKEEPVALRGNTILFLMRDKVEAEHNTAENILEGIRMSGIRHILFEYRMWLDDQKALPIIIQLAQDPRYTCGAHFLPRSWAYGQPDQDNRPALQEDLKKAKELGILNFAYCDGNHKLYPNDPFNLVTHLEIIRENISTIKTFELEKPGRWMQAGSMFENSDLVNGVGQRDQNYGPEKGVAEYYPAFEYLKSRQEYISHLDKVWPQWIRRDVGWFGEEIGAATEPVKLLDPTEYKMAWLMKLQFLRKSLRPDGSIDFWSSVGLTYRTTMERMARKDSTLELINQLELMISDLH